MYKGLLYSRLEFILDGNEITVTGKMNIQYWMETFYKLSSEHTTTKQNADIPLVGMNDIPQVRVDFIGWTMQTIVVHITV